MNEFYVGYLPKAPIGIARRIRAVVVLLFIFAAIAATAVAIVVCRAGPAARRCKSSTQPDGGEGLAMTQGLSPQGRSEGSV